jgi:high affinity Mn2+ porin
MIILCLHALSLRSQSDSTKLPWYNFHFQQTVITQYHPAFSAKYTGFSSLHPEEETQSSLTTTLFLGLRLWKGSSFYFNPELAGGSGFSQARGIAGFPNGETFRIGSPAPAIYLARLYLQQVFPLSKKFTYTEEGPNQIKEKVFEKQIRWIAGKYSVADFFDCNSYSHDPRSQFMNWSLMSNGAWDYPANTRGYTWGTMLEYTSPKFEARIGFNLEPTYANGPILDWNVDKALASTAELQYNYSIGKRKGNIKILGFYNKAAMGSYTLAVLNPDTTDISLTRKYSRSKYGYGINIEQELNDWIGLFARASWNDGRNETWAFTEIDQSAHLGLSFNGTKWKRKNDVLGLAFAANGISIYHQAYLKKGGYGFIIGDGNLNYSPEMITEIYYNFVIPKLNLSITPDYQYIINPAYNVDRGPVHVFSLRAHIQF